MSNRCTARLYIDGVEWFCQVEGEHRGHFDGEGRSWSAPEPAICNRCGATVQVALLHDEWHASVVTRDLLIEVLGTATRRENYDQ